MITTRLSELDRQTLESILSAVQKPPCDRGSDLEFHRGIGWLQAIVASELRGRLSSSEGEPHEPLMLADASDFCRWTAVERLALIQLLVELSHLATVTPSGREWLKWILRNCGLYCLQLEKGESPIF